MPEGGVAAAMPETDRHAAAHVPAGTLCGGMRRQNL